ncbi:LysR family transcriptional regulator [bacterium D16-54]|nr:LysR family transcriptional regulator [bacterium D16-54]RKJ16533.1 LysR family transcriptional regulator [bacterium D16-56]
MDLKNLNTFIQVAEMSSFTKAARILGYSQSTVSFQIRQLEEEWKIQLFERISHNISLTEKGREMLRYAHGVRRMTQEMEAAIRSDAKVGGHIRLAMADSLVKPLLWEDFRDFRCHYPDITLKIRAVGTEEMFRLLDHNEVDLVLTLDKHIYNMEYVIAEEERFDVHFVAGADSFWAGKKGLSIGEILGEPFILTEKGMSYRRLMDERLAALSLEVSPVLEIGNTDLICQMVRQGLGISFLPDYATAEAVREGKMVYLDVRDFQVEVWKQVLYHRDKWVSPSMERVMEFCMGVEGKGNKDEIAGGFSSENERTAGRGV